MLRPTVVVDKCYLQGSKTDHIRELCLSHNILMTDVLFYELISSSEPQRSRCFAKFPPTENPVSIIQHTGALLRKEINSHAPSGKPSDNPENIRYRFHPELATGEYVFPEDARQALDEENYKTHESVVSFIQRVRIIKEIFPELLIGSDFDKAAANQEAVRIIVSDTTSILKFYSNFESPVGEKPLPPVEIITPAWALFRWVQIQLLMSLDVFFRYQGKIPEASELTHPWYDKIEHDLLDAEYLVLGVLEGSFATTERKLQRYWQMLRPDGVLLS
jgi:hypothetical protein